MPTTEGERGKRRDRRADQRSQKAQGGGEFLDRFVFSPHHPVYVFYDRLMIILHFVSSLCYGYLSAFRHKHEAEAMAAQEAAMNIVEGLFFINMVANCFKEYQPDHALQPVTECKLIASHYYSTDLLWDLIPLVPLQLLELKRSRHRLFYLIKIVRIKSFWKYYYDANIQQYFKKKQMMMIENLIKQDPEKAMDKNQNLTRSTDLLFIGFGTKMIELIFIIFTMAYLCGILWIV